LGFNTLPLYIYLGPQSWSVLELSTTHKAKLTALHYLLYEKYQSIKLIVNVDCRLESVKILAAAAVNINRPSLPVHSVLGCSVGYLI